MVAVKDGKYALVNEETGEIVETLGTYGDHEFYAADAESLATLIRPDWKTQGLKLWLKVGRQ